MHTCRSMPETKVPGRPAQGIQHPGAETMLFPVHAAMLSPRPQSNLAWPGCVITLLDLPGAKTLRDGTTLH